jgi:hypothetical protein
MNDDEKCQLIADLLADKGLREGEGVQRLAYAMTQPIRKNISGQTQKEFVYVKPKSGDKDRAYAYGLRHMAEQPGVSPGTASMYNRIADSWDEYANLPKWQRVLMNFLNKHFERFVLRHKPPSR